MTGDEKTKKKESKMKVPPRFELGLLDSESNVLTARPWDRLVRKEKIKPTYWLLYPGAYLHHQLTNNDVTCLGPYTDSEHQESNSFTQ